ncbi:hypothetical protein PBI_MALAGASYROSE_82 [Mycobacterium phage MalagasyRose]|uniref:Uncharacterized protein n=1 Tax=Mycobacterium phage MalagasyRose TaxID=2599870 RepID=A0A5J6TDP1_9CAUD|nr:hypothetical protein QEH39_gp06 [Mycobacterium phage MalagasyRose]QFG08930.1 hypothetical protein PBI_MALAGASYROSE_82 [Mycobacterium phage MalagasyRose]
MPKLDVQVFIPRGPVQRNHVIKAALNKVRNDLPPTLTCDAQITGHDRRPDDHEQPGTDYTVTIDYTERGEGQPTPGVIPVGTYGATADDEDDVDGVDAALDAVSVDNAAGALKAAGVSQV